MRTVRWCALNKHRDVRYLIHDEVQHPLDSRWPDEMVDPAELIHLPSLPCLKHTHSLLTQKTLSLYSLEVVR